MDAIRDGAPVEGIRGVHGRSVIAALALASSAVTIDQITSALWGDDAPANPASNIRTVVSRLRSSFGADTIEARSGSYALTATVRTDAAAVESVARSMRQPDVEPSRELDLIDGALDRWRGEALTGVASTPWFLGQQHRLAELRNALRVRRWELLLESGRAEVIVPELMEAASEQPGSEAVHVLLIRGLRVVNRSSEAARVASSFRRRLAETTGFEPSSAFGDAEAEVFANPDRDTTKIALDLAPASDVAWPTDRFVGRRDDIERTAAAVSQHQLVTIVGPGGIGKTRLAIETARRWNEGDLRWVWLADDALESGVLSAVGQALGLPDLGERPTEAIATSMSRSSAILVLDNAEHVADEVRTLVRALLPRIGSARLVVTSRRSLGLSGEHVIRLRTLDHSSSDDDPVDSPAVALLIERVHELDVGFNRSEAAEAELLDICAAVSGLPLGIELAAARVATLGPQVVATQLNEGVTDLGRRTVTPERHDSFGALVDWSVRLLDDQTRPAFAVLSVFAGWFDAHAAVDVMGEHPAPYEALHELVSGSLLESRGERGATRYRMLEPVREVAHEQLAGISPDALHDARVRHTEWVGARIEAMYSAFMGPYDSTEPDRAQRELDLIESDVIAALRHLREGGDAESAERLSVRLAPLLTEHARLRLTTEICDHTPTTAAGGVAIALTMLEQRDPDHLAIQLATARSSLEAGDAVTGFLASYADCLVAFYRSDFEASHRLAVELIDADDTEERYRSVATGVVALALRFSQDVDEARDWLSRQPSLHPAGGYTDYVHSSAVAAQDPEAAIRLLERSRRQAAAEHVTFQARLAEVEMLWQLHLAGRTTDCFRHARRLIPRLLAGGYDLQVWTALRILVLDLGDQHIDEAIHLLEAIRSNPEVRNRPSRAPHEEQALADRLGASALDDPPDGSRPVAADLEELWSMFEPILAAADPIALSAEH